MHQIRDLFRFPAHCIAIMILWMRTEINFRNFIMKFICANLFALILSVVIPAVFANCRTHSHGKRLTWRDCGERESRYTASRDHVHHAIVHQPALHMYTLMGLFISHQTPVQNHNPFKLFPWLLYCEIELCWMYVDTRHVWCIPVCECASVWLSWEPTATK